MTKIRVTKEFNFEIAHALWNYDGPCANIHGHSYRMFVTVIGEPISVSENPKNGMVIDFGDLKKLLNKKLLFLWIMQLYLTKKLRKVLNH